MAPALLVRVRHDRGLRTLETCNMQTLGSRKTFSNLEHMKTGSSKTFQPVCFGKHFLGPSLQASPLLLALMTVQLIMQVLVIEQIPSVNIVCTSYRHLRTVYPVILSGSLTCPGLQQ